MRVPLVHGERCVVYATRIKTVISCPKKSVIVSLQRDFQRATSFFHSVRLRFNIPEKKQIGNNKKQKKLVPVSHTLSLSLTLNTIVVVAVRVHERICCAVSNLCKLHGIYRKEKSAYIII